MPAHRLCVLIVDDNVDAALSLAELVRLDGHEVHAAHEGYDAIRKAMRLRPDILFLDIGLPGADGLEIAQVLRKDQALAGLRIIALTGYGKEEDRRKAVDVGVDQYLLKPYDPTFILSLLGTVRPRSRPKG
jgi:CheY-like chemotaxis protein